MTEQESRLREGVGIRLTSDDHELEAWYDAESGWKQGFKIFFNGTIVHSSKTFKSYERKLNQLVAEYGLENN